eukprot:gene10143-12441_t
MKFIWEPVVLDHYDFIIDITTISDIVNGWNIYVNNNKILKSQKESKKLLANGNYQQQQSENELTNLNLTMEKDVKELLKLNDNFIIVAVLGLFNRGKTYCINLLTGQNLPNNQRIQTRGLSFIQTKEDTAGGNSPLNFNSFGSPADTELLAQKKATEMFIQDLSYSFGDVLIVVVNELTLPDQEFIKVLQMKLASDSGKSGHGGPLLVIHNFQTIETEKDLMLMWGKYVTSTQRGENIYQIFNGKRAIYYKEDSIFLEAKKVTTFHFCIAKGDSKFGSEWNQLTKELIKMVLLGRAANRNESIDSLIIKNINNTLNTFCRDPNPVTLKPYKVQDLAVKVEEKDSLEFVSDQSDDDENQDKSIQDMKKKWEKPIDSIGNYSEKTTPCFRICPVDENNNNNSQAFHLIADKIDLIGNPILLDRNKDNFVPSYDVITNHRGMTIMIDAPGFVIPDNNNNCKGPAKGDTFTLSIERQPFIRLIITGTRNLYNIFFDESGKLVVTNYSTQENIIDGCQFKFSQDHPRRQDGKFQIIIPIPHHIDDHLDNCTEGIKDGIYFIFFKVKSNNAKPKVNTIQY